MRVVDGPIELSISGIDSRCRDCYLEIAPGHCPATMHRRKRITELIMKIRLTELFAHLRVRPSDVESSGKTDAGPPPKPAPGLAASYPYHCVSIRPGKPGCARAVKLRGVRILSRSAPSLPLPGCTVASECTCRFQKYNDRRHIDRRLFGAEPDPRHFSGAQRRQLFGRRTTDPRPRAV